MALGALDRQPQHGRAEDLDLVADHVDPVLQQGHVIHTRRIGRHTQEPRGHQIVHHLLSDDRSVHVIHKFVAGNLLEQKSIVGLVRIEGPDHIVPVAPCLTSILTVPILDIGITRQIEPIAPPPFTVTGGRQQAVNQLLIGLRILVREECLSFFRGGWQSGKIEVGSPDQCEAIRLRRERQSLCLELLQDESVNRIADAILVADGGRFNRSRRPERPKLPVLITHQRIRLGSGHVGLYIPFRSTLCNPLLELLDFRLDQWADTRLKELLGGHLSGQDLLQH